MVLSNGNPDSGPPVITLPGSGGTVSFRYDPLGRRIYKSSSLSTSLYTYEGPNLIEETTSSGTAVARYLQAQNVDEPLAELRSGTSSYYEADGLGSVTSLTALNGSMVETYSRDSFGKQNSSSGSLQNLFRYTARDFDDETNLYYYRARYYDSTAGRFISSDPTEFFSSVNFYWYADNSPLGLRDPFGLSPDSCGCPASTPGALPRSVGLALTGIAAAGAGSLGGSVATGAAGFASSPSSRQGFASGGIATSAGNFVKGAPSNQRSDGGAVAAGAYGAAVGGGLAVTFSNGEPCQLRGLFRTMNFDIGFGINFSGSFAFGPNNTYQVTFGIPGLSWGYGAELSYVTTNTAVTGGSSCGCGNN